MPLAASLLDRLGRPGDIRLGATPRGDHPLLPTGIRPLDELLGGGLPRGRLTELAGRRSTGRTSLACAMAAHATQRGEIVGWVDSTDALDPETLVTTGIAPTRVLWVRPRTEHDAPRAAELLLGAGGFGLVVLDLAEAASPSAVSWPRLVHAAERTARRCSSCTERRAGTYAMPRSSPACAARNGAERPAAVLPTASPPRSPSPVIVAARPDARSS
jgi:hypothetical protein